jgi:hypothetical protein
MNEALYGEGKRKCYMEFSMIFLPILLILLGTVVGVGLGIWWIAMIIDCCRRQFDKGIERVIWLLILIFVIIPLPAFLIYFFLIVKYHPQGLIDKEGRFK